METQTTMLIVFVVILVIMFGSVSVQYIDTSKYSGVPIDAIDNRYPDKIPVQTALNNAVKSTSRVPTAHNQAAPKYGLFGLPEKDEYMNPAFKAQIDELRNVIYYDNCRYQLI
jgi:hypothetical protein